MTSRIAKTFGKVDMEERILTGAALLAAVSVFLPWISGEWLSDEEASYSGFEFFTSFLGIVIFLLQAGVIVIGLAPVFGKKQLVKRRYRDLVRAVMASQATVLSLASLSVLTAVTYDYTLMTIRFGVYLTFIGSLVAAFYAFWMHHQAHKEEQPHELFHHPDEENREEHSMPHDAPSFPAPPPPPPPPAEEHRIHG